MYLQSECCIVYGPILQTVGYTYVTPLQVFPLNTSGNVHNGNLLSQCVQLLMSYCLYQKTKRCDNSYITDLEQLGTRTCVFDSMSCHLVAMNATDRTTKMTPRNLHCPDQQFHFPDNIPNATFTDGGRRHWQIVYWVATPISDCFADWLRVKWR